MQEYNNQIDFHPSEASVFFDFDRDCEFERSESANHAPDATPERSSVRGNEGMTVRMMARKLGKSVRSVQRMLRRGELKGYKINGPKGPEWRVLAQQSAAKKQDFASSDSNLAALESKIAVLELRLEARAAELQTLRSYVDSIESKWGALFLSLDSNIVSLARQIADREESTSKSWWQKIKER